MSYIKTLLIVPMLLLFSLAAMAAKPVKAKPQQKQQAADSVKIYDAASKDSIARLDNATALAEEDAAIGGEEEEEGEIPAAGIYPEWSHSSVNPYGSKIENTIDSVHVDLSGFCFPLPTFYRVNSEFGFRRSRHHNGIDLKVTIGDSVVCAFDGMVRIAQNQKRGYGNHVVVRHNNGLETVYAHLNKILVEENQVVHAGELLGEGGNTGRSTGPHLHFEVRYLGQAVNPRDVIDFSNDKLCCYGSETKLTKKNFEYIKEVKATKSWTVKKGDTLGRISQKTGVSITKLCSMNKISKNKVLRIGQKIRYS